MVFIPVTPIRIISASRYIQKRIEVDFLIIYYQLTYTNDYILESSFSNKHRWRYDGNINAPSTNTRVTPKISSWRISKLLLKFQKWY